MTTTNMLKTLFEAAEPNLTDEQFVKLDRCTEEARIQLENLSQLAIGLGSLVSQDQNSGAFQNAKDLSALLYMFGNVIETASETIWIANEAGHIGRQRQQDARADENRKRIRSA